MPTVYQVNTRVWLTDMSRKLGRPATLDDVPDRELDDWQHLGFDWIYLLGVWQTGEAGRMIARSDPQLRQSYRQTLPDLHESDICGSCFAVKQYVVHPVLGGDPALARLRRRLHEHDLRLILDFVPNHTALDHDWAYDHPEYYVPGSEADLATSPGNYIRLQTSRGQIIVAHGRDPNFPAWTDTLQLNYAQPTVHEAMQHELIGVAGRCDGVRCDMAMLILPDVFQRTWRLSMQPFWPQAIERVHRFYPNTVFMAEVYWNLEATLLEQGFDYVYDKRFYDLLRARRTALLREHLRTDVPTQRHAVHFLENHDESRAAAVFPLEVHKPAAVLAFLSPGLRFFHQGQLEGRTTRIPVQLCRAPDEPVDLTLRTFYESLLGCIRLPVVQQGNWQLLDCSPAWDGNWTWDCFVASIWHRPAAERVLVVVNYAGNQAQCYVRLPFGDLQDRAVRLRDLLGPASYDRQGGSLVSPGLYLDLPPWGYHVFELM